MQLVPRKAIIQSTITIPRKYFAREIKSSVFTFSFLLSVRRCEGSPLFPLRHDFGTSLHVVACVEVSLGHLIALENVTQHPLYVL